MGLRTFHRGHTNTKIRVEFSLNSTSPSHHGHVLFQPGVHEGRTLGAFEGLPVGCALEPAWTTPYVCMKQNTHLWPCALPTPCSWAVRTAPTASWLHAQQPAPLWLPLPHSQHPQRPLPIGPLMPPCPLAARWAGRTGAAGKSRSGWLACKQCKRMMLSVARLN